MNYKKIAKEVLLTEANELKIASQNIADEITDAISLISKIKGKLIITGVGKSGLVGSKMAATFASTGTSSFFLHPTEAMHGDLGMIGKDDALLAISYSGESEELTRMLPHIKRFDIPLIAMAKDASSTLGKYADVFLSIAITKEACPLGIAPTSSTTLTMALGDALAVCMMEKRGFKKEDFASFHPGGSLGKMLFIKIKDIMRYANLPIVAPKTPLKKAIVIMSEGRLGNVLIAQDGVLKAVLSDGDLRRALLRDDFSMDADSIKYASSNPKYITDENMLASDALKLIEEHKLQHLVVTDEDKKIKGVLHIHDLVEAGIK
jgi:arabinose-5-phosphate isomerase